MVSRRCSRPRPRSRVEGDVGLAECKAPTHALLDGEPLGRRLHHPPELTACITQATEERLEPHEFQIDRRGQESLCQVKAHGCR